MPGIEQFGCPTACLETPRQTTIFEAPRARLCASARVRTL